VVAFHEAYLRGELVPPPDDYAELILIPAVLNTPWAVYNEYPPAIKLQTRNLLISWLASGQMAIETVNPKG
jgi:hypothetical protein